MYSYVFIPPLFLWGGTNLPPPSVLKHPEVSVWSPLLNQGVRGRGAARSQTRNTSISSRFYAMFGRFVILNLSGPSHLSDESGWRSQRQWPYLLKSCWSWKPSPSPIEGPHFRSYPHPVHSNLNFIHLFDSLYSFCTRWVHLPTNPPILIAPVHERVYSRFLVLPPAGSDSTITQITGYISFLVY